MRDPMDKTEYEQALQNLPQKPAAPRVRPTVMEALTLLSQTFTFDGKTREDLERIGATWTIALDGVTDRQIKAGTRHALQTHQYKSILPGAFREYCQKASEAARSDGGGLVGGWRIWRDEKGYEHAWHPKLRHVLEEPPATIHT